MSTADNFNKKCVVGENEEVNFAYYPSIHAHYDLPPRVNVAGEYDLQDSTTPEQEADFTSYTRLPLLPMKFRAVRISGCCNEAVISTSFVG
ncbi:hypothetical protein PI124_g12299 [Phytophthora idaei]|nr:hypothetical protein PI126_g10788 [Phytophthora idaei]KAG3242862.1 hypothetical protein PI124_g12299 [Phytophthora idaei]